MSANRIITLLSMDLARRPRPVRVDSRLVQPGDIFVALPSATPGKADQRAEHLRQALEKGAATLVTEQLPQSDGLTRSSGDSAIWILVDDARDALGQLLGAAHGTEHLPFPLIGVTGTNGKTTCTYLLEHLYRSTGKKTGTMGTVSYRWPGHDEAAPLTTPDCLTLHASLAAMRDAGVDAAFMEVASHALDQKRVAGLTFAAALFTNLTQDHLDYHGDMETYFQAKMRLMRDVPAKNKLIVANADDPYGQRILGEFPQAVGYGTAPAHAGPFLHGAVRSNTPEGLSIDLAWGAERWNQTSPLVGRHNAANLMGVMALALGMGFKPADFACFSNFYGVSGRLERIPAPGLGVFVDYAHTPDALVRAQEALREAGFARLITVFGCGGDRDATKRPIMGDAVARLSDIAVVTSDNPRTENPDAIIDGIMPGMAVALQTPGRVHREPDRRKALELAVRLARPGDALLVAGKGHEPYQIIGTVKHPFSDQAILKELLSCA